MRRGFKSRINFAVAFVCAIFVMEMTMLHMAAKAEPTAHDFVFENIEGGELRLADYVGKVILLTNTASMCGFTPQYQALQTVWEEYGARGLVVIGVPSRDFGGQEYGSNSRIKQFCEINYRIDFPMTEAVKVRGEDAHPYYRWARDQGRMMTPRWNFYKHLIDAEGRIVDWFASTTAPDSRRVKAAIEAILPR